DSSRRSTVCSSTACSCRAGTRGEKDSAWVPSGSGNRVAARVSGVRHACIVHQRVTAANAVNTADTPIITRNAPTLTRLQETIRSTRTPVGTGEAFGDDPWQAPNHALHPIQSASTLGLPPFGLRRPIGGFDSSDRWPSRQRSESSLSER